MENTYFVEGFLDYRYKKTGAQKIFHREWKLEQSNFKKGSVIIIHGLGEHSGRYTEVGEFFNKIGFDVYCEDLPGFGNSYGKRGDIKNMKDYIKLVKSLYDRVLSQRTDDQKMILYGHSMGGLLALWYLENYPKDFDMGIISAPSLKPSKKVPGYLLFVSKLIKPVFPSLPFKNRIESHQLTDDESIAEEYKKDDFTHAFITPRFFWQLEDVSRDVLQNKNLIAKNLKILFIHGADDTLVDYEDTKEFYDSLEIADKSLLILEGIRHEPHKASNRAQVFRAVKEWIESRT